MVMHESERKWFHIHRSTLLVGGFTLLVLACLVFPGDGSTGYAFGSSVSGGRYYNSWNTYFHGWPWVFLNRTVYEESRFSGLKSPIPWLTFSSWLLTRGNEFQFNPRALVEDVLVALAIAIAFVAAFEVRRRRRRSAWEFRLADIFALFLLISLVLAWWKVQHDERMNQEVHVSAIEQHGHSVHGGAYGPEWIRRLTGVDLEIIPGVDEVELWLTSPEEPSSVLPHLQALRTLRSIRILEASPSGAKTFSLSHLQSLKQLRHMDLASTEVDDSIIPELVKLPQLESIDLDGTKVSPAGIARLHELLPQCEITSP